MNIPWVLLRVASSADFRQDCNGGTDIELGYDWLCLSVYGSNKWVNSYYRDAQTFTITVLHTQCSVFPCVSEFDVMCVDIIWILLLHLQLQMTQRHVRSLNFFIQLFLKVLFALRNKCLQMFYESTTPFLLKKKDSRGPSTPV